jgi:hypothetical protein
MGICMGMSIGIGGGFLFYTITGYLTNYDKKYSCILKIGENNLHIHHWMYCIFLLMIFIWTDYYFVIGFLIGAIIQGLTYDDCFEILKTKD